MSAVLGRLLIGLGVALAAGAMDFASAVAQSLDGQYKGEIRVSRERRCSLDGEITVTVRGSRVNGETAFPRGGNAKFQGRVAPDGSFTTDEKGLTAKIANGRFAGAWDKFDARSGSNCHYTFDLPHQ